MPPPIRPGGVGLEAASIKLDSFLRVAGLSGGFCLSGDIVRRRRASATFLGDREDTTPHDNQQHPQNPIPIFSHDGLHGLQLGGLI
jgi:hypothetical protein